MSLAIGDEAPPFSLPTTAGETVALGDFFGRPALALAFWCNHCPYVRAWEERLNAIAQDYAGRGVAVVAVNANDAEAYPADAPERMAERAEDAGYAFPYAHDATQETARAYGAQRTPEVFVVDASGRVAYHGAIDDDANDPDAVRRTYLRDALDAVLEGTGPAVAETAAVGCTIKWRR